MKPRLRPTVSGLLLICIALSVGLRVPYVLMTPGPEFNTIGTIHEQPAISISGTKTYPTSGSLNMTTVSEFGGSDGGISLWQAVSGWFSTHDRVVPREYVYPDHMTKEQNKQQAAEEYASSQSYAIAAALGYLKRPVRETPVIVTVEEGAPSQGLLHAGDIVAAVDGVATSKPTEVVARVHAVKPGTPITFTVVRNKVRSNVVVTSTHREDDPTTAADESGTSYVGIAVDSQYAADFGIDFGVNGVGGPSGGLMFTLGIIDMLTPGALADGRDIAGTGTITPDGVVGTIGGIQQKMLGARAHNVVLFLAPKGNCDSVLGHIPDGLTVAAVSNVSDAMTAIDDFTHGRTPIPCSTK